MFSRLLLRVDGEVLVVPSEVCLECPRRHAALGGPPLPVGVPGEPGDKGELNGLSLSNTGDPLGSSPSGVAAAELRGELGWTSSG